MKTSLSLTIILGVLAGSLLAVVNDCRDVNKVTEPQYWWSWYGSQDFHEALCKEERDHEGVKCFWKKIKKSCGYRQVGFDGKKKIKGGK